MADPTAPEPIRAEVSIETRLSPEDVIDSLVEFGPRRLEMWPSLDPTKFAAHAVGEGWADVTEGSAEPDIWARERYEWTDDQVTSTVIDSSFCLPGSSVEYRVHPAGDGGSVVDVVWQRTPKAPEYQPMFDAIVEQGPEMLRSHFATIWDGLADSAR